MKLKGRCQVEGCSKAAKYGLYRTRLTEKVWLDVCEHHEKIIGDENMRKAGGRYEQPKTRADESNKCPPHWWKITIDKDGNQIHECCKCPARKFVKKERGGK